MPKASKVGKFRAAAKASSRNVRDAPLTSQHLAQKNKDVTSSINNLEGEVTESAKEESEATLSRGQRKRLAKREQYLKREKMVMSSLRLQRLEEQKGKIDGLDAIREALGEASSSTSRTKSMIAAAKEIMSKSNNRQNGNTTKKIINTNKSKKTLAATEITHMSLVLQHPSFKSNPFESIQQHLRNSLSDDAKKLKLDSIKRNEEDDKAAVKKKEERKERIRDAKFNKSKKGGSRRGYKSNRAGRV